MAAQRGKDMLLKMRDPLANAYVTIAGLRTRRLVFDQQTVDITDSESAGRWRELLGGSGVRRASLSAAGIFKDKASDALLRSRFFNADPVDVELIIPDFGTLSGQFLVSGLEYAGNHDGEVTFDLALESASALTFVEAS
jgi:TP901-1 family phage major tail protein